MRPCVPCSLGNYQPHKGRTQCFSCGQNTATSFRGSTSFSDCLITSERRLRFQPGP
ncbi:MAG: hypothetical protein GY696_09335 [Gammaproteobacteria bacterium]|nr:hypothetical protein [Gammaproteobacteria bacterium]